MKKSLPPEKEIRERSGCGTRMAVKRLLCLAVLLISALHVSPPLAYSQPKKLFTLTIRDAYLTELFLQIEKQSNYSFVYQTDEITDDHVVIRHKEGQQAKSDRVTIEGRVLDEYRKSLAGVSVVVKGTRYGTTTDAKGEFKIVAPRQKDMVVRFSFIGMTPQEISYVEGKKLYVNLQQSSTDIGNVEVVHTGYQ